MDGKQLILLTNKGYIMTQGKTLLKHLKHTAITKLQALRMYGILNTGNEIFKLRQKGHKIITHMIPRAEGSPFASYRLEK